MGRLMVEIKLYFFDDNQVEHERSFVTEIGNFKIPMRDIIDQLIVDYLKDNHGSLPGSYCDSDWRSVEGKFRAC
jgi:hypothetical protein